MKPPGEVEADFNAIAAALAEGSPHAPLTIAERAVLRAIPAHARTGIDVGCGHGPLTRRAAERGLAMLGVDMAPKMIELARLQTGPELPVEYRVGDIMGDVVAPRTFDVVIAVNVVHHLPHEIIVPRLASLVAPGGRLIIQDVVTRDGLRHLAVNVVAVLWRMLRRSRTPAPRVQRLYDQHGETETYLTPENVARTLRPLLPGVCVTHHLEWRYTATWDRVM